MKILVIGANLIGLSCAQSLCNQNHDVTIIDSVNEIGHPQNYPGLVEGIVDLSEFDTQIHLTDTGCRRSWLEKSLAQSIPATFHLSVNIENFSKEYDEIIDTRSACVEKWEGGVTLNGREPTLEIIVHRSDGTVECWTQGELPDVEGGWLERFSGYFDLHTASIDSAIIKGRDLAESAQIKKSR